MWYSSLQLHDYINDCSDCISINNIYVKLIQVKVLIERLRKSIRTEIRTEFGNWISIQTNYCTCTVSFVRVPINFINVFEWFHLLVLLSGLHHNKVPLVVQPFMKVVVMCLFETRTDRTWCSSFHGIHQSISRTDSRTETTS